MCADLKIRVLRGNMYVMFELSSEEFSRAREEAPPKIFSASFHKTQPLGHNLDPAFTLQTGSIAELDPDHSEKTGTHLPFCIRDAFVIYIVARFYKSL